VAAVTNSSKPIRRMTAKPRSVNRIGAAWAGSATQARADADRRIDAAGTSTPVIGRL